MESCRSGRRATPPVTWGPELKWHNAGSDLSSGCGKGTTAANAVKPAAWRGTGDTRGANKIQGGTGETASSNVVVLVPGGRWPAAGGEVTAGSEGV